MNRDNLKIAIQEAERFLEKASKLPDPEPYPIGHHMHGRAMDNFPKEWGSIRRASMDLTRSLSDLRNQS